jgi:hypothetical protein
MSTSEYWIVSRKTDYREDLEIKRGNDQIIFIAIPKEIKRGFPSAGDIRLCRVQKTNLSI